MTAGLGRPVRHRSALLARLAEADPLRAFDLALASASPVERLEGLQMAVSRAAASDPAQAQQLAEKVLALAARMESRQLLQTIAMSWGGADPKAATDWLLANSTRVPPEAFQLVAASFAFNDPAVAAAYIDRVPRESRGAWIAAVAQSQARSDVQAAVRFVEQYRGDPAYALASTGVAHVLAEYDPRSAAQLLSDGDLRSPQAAGAAMMVAERWAGLEPRAAADWARNLPDSVRPAALSSVVRMPAQAMPGLMSPPSFGPLPYAVRERANAVGQASNAAPVRIESSRSP